MYLVLVFLPLFGSISAGLFGRLIGREGAKYIPTACVGTAAFLSWIALYEVGLAGSPVYIDLIPWIDSRKIQHQIHIESQSCSLSRKRRDRQK